MSGLVWAAIGVAWVLAVVFGLSLCVMASRRAPRPGRDDALDHRRGERLGL